MSPAAVTFASGHMETYKEGVKFFEGVWLPAGIILSKNMTFFWDRSAVLWKFSLGATSGAEEVTMSGFLGMLGMGGEPEHEPEVVPIGPDGPNHNDFASLAAQVAQLRQWMERM